MGKFNFVACSYQKIEPNTIFGKSPFKNRVFLLELLIGASYKGFLTPISIYLKKKITLFSDFLGPKNSFPLRRT
jgi:hypothetical protein